MATFIVRAKAALGHQRETREIQAMRAIVDGAVVRFERQAFDYTEEKPSYEVVAAFNMAEIEGFERRGY